ncbi:MAG TPA: ABC transporter permease [Blastocatellia bacterium]|nr:ABC transporter permease [Blastocatellia bacterium]
MRELLAQTLSNLLANKLRSFLTMFGIIWGVTSIVLLSAMGEGFQRGNAKVLNEFGRNIVIVFPGRTSMQAGGERAGTPVRLTVEDAMALRQESKLLEYVAAEITRGGIKVRSAFNAASPGVSGIWPVYQKIRTIELERGRLFTDADDEEARRVAIIGYDVSKQLFADRDPVGAQVMLNGIPYTVIGKMRRKDQDSSYTGPDNGRIFLTHGATRKDFPLSGPLDTPDTLSTIICSPYDHVVEELNRIVDAEGTINFERGGPVDQEIRAILARRHGFDPKDNEAAPTWNTAMESVMFRKMIKSMREFFLIVSVITLALGGIGVMNIMLIAVRERTKEIGIRKALGATSRNIQWLFFSEGLFLTLLSGMIGLGVGTGLCALVNLLPMPERFSGMTITWQVAVLAIGALSLVGVLASTYPARRAAEMMPIEALRYEM